MHLSNGRIIHLLVRQRDGVELQRLKHWQRTRLRLWSIAKRDQCQCNLALSIYPQETIDSLIDKSQDHFGRHRLRGRHGERVGNHGASVPETMPIGACLVLPGITPEGAGADDGERRRSHSRFTTSRLHQELAIIALAQATEGEVPW